MFLSKKNERQCDAVRRDHLFHWKRQNIAYLVVCCNSRRRSVPKRAGSLRALQLKSAPFWDAKTTNADKTANRAQAHALLKWAQGLNGGYQKMKKNLTRRLLVAAAFFFAISGFSREAFSDDMTALTAMNMNSTAEASPASSMGPRDASPWASLSPQPTSVRLGRGHLRRLLQVLLSRYENVVSYAQVGLRQLGFRTLEFALHL